MNKTDFVKAFAAKAEISQKEAKKMVDVMGDVIVEHMKDENGVTPFNGIKFHAVYRDERNARNPRTGETFIADARYSPRVKFGKCVKDAIN